MCSVSCLEDIPADSFSANANAEDDVSHDVTFNHVNASAANGRVRKEECLYRQKKIVRAACLVGLEPTVSAHLPCETRSAVNFLQRIFSTLSSIRRERGGEEDKEGRRSRVHFKREAAISVRPPL